MLLINITFPDSRSISEKKIQLPNSKLQTTAKLQTVSIFAFLYYFTLIIMVNIARVRSLNYIIILNLLVLSSIYIQVNSIRQVVAKVGLSSPQNTEQVVKPG